MGMRAQRDCSCGMACIEHIITNRFGLYDELSDNREPKRFVMMCSMQAMPQEQPCQNSFAGCVSVQGD